MRPRKSPEELYAAFSAAGDKRKATCKARRDARLPGEAEAILGAKRKARAVREAARLAEWETYELTRRIAEW